jgi:four helix bundle protein
MMGYSATLVVRWSMQDARNLVVTEYAHRLAVATYRHTESFPSAERFGVAAQMRRAAVSIASNIAEGCGRRSNRELLQFLYIASGSASELACQLRIATDLGFGDPESAEHLGSETRRVTKMLSRLITFLRNQPAWRQKEGRP